MKKILIILALLAPFVYGQAIYNPTTIYPFTVGNDTILSAANLTSGTISIGNRQGAFLCGIQADTMAGGGTVAKDIAVYVKVKITGLNWGVVSDSLGADSMFVCTYDSASVNNEKPLYIDFPNLTWWNWFDQLQIILDPAAGADSIRIISRFKGQ
jgi:hypothetical protein